MSVRYRAALIITATRTGMTPVHRPVGPDLADRVGHRPHFVVLTAGSARFGCLHSPQIRGIVRVNIGNRYIPEWVRLIVRPENSGRRTVVLQVARSQRPYHGLLQDNGLAGRRVIAAVVQLYIFACK